MLFYRHSVETFCRETKPLVNECYDSLGRIATFRYNDAVGNINSTDKFHRLALRFSKTFCNVSVNGS